jgi:hypothetical protein
MTRIIRSADCGNSPKNAFVERLTIGIATRDAELVRDCVTDQAEWTTVGGDRRVGKMQIEAALNDANAGDIASVRIDRVVSHGKAGAANGTIEYRRARTVGFCYVYEFASAKGSSVARIVSYVVDA